MSLGSTKTNRNLWLLHAHGEVVTHLGVHTNLQDTTRAILATSTVVTGPGNSEWRRLIRRGQSATSGLDGRLYMLKPGDGVAKAQVKSTKDWVIDSGSVCSGQVYFNLSPGIINVDADNRARSQLLSHYINLRNNWRGGNFLAEIRETLHMFRHPLDTAYAKTLKFVRNVDKIKRLQKGKSSLANALANDYLAYAFGLKPLIADIHDAADAFNKVNDPEKADRFPISGKGKVESGDVIVANATVTPKATGSGNLLDNIERNVSSVKYYGYVAARSFGAGLKVEKFGVDPFDVVPAAWEAIPFSWFVDYFVNVSEVLDGMRLWNAGVAWLNRGVRNSMTVTQASLRTTNSDATYQNKELSGSGAWTGTVFVQRRASSLPHPNWVFKMPGMFSLKWLNIASVIQQHRR